MSVGSIRAASMTRTPQSNQHRTPNDRCGQCLGTQTWALDAHASSLVLYNGHAGLGANLAGPPHEAAIDRPSSASDEVLVAFENGQLRSPLVVAPLWDSKSAPPQRSGVPTTTGPAAHRQHHNEAVLRATDGELRVLQR
ncbi:MAG TPA: hypothetical protein VFK10_20080 [Burkholderiaceae bacterium]|nr:hypothetical protein [Burkholderiaceae bacterium]